MATPSKYWLEKDATIIAIDGTTPANGTIRVYYTKVANTLSSSTDEPFDGITRFDRFHDAIVSGAVAKILLRAGAQKQSLMYQQEFDKQVSNARKLAQSQLDSPIAVIGVAL